MRYNDYDEVKGILEKSKKIFGEGKTMKIVPQRPRNVLSEEIDGNRGKAIAITDDPRFGSQVLSNQIDSFRQTVHPGAKFATANEEDPEKSPLVYFPDSGNLVFSGSIPSLAGLKFQYSLNDVTGAPYIFVDGLALTDDTVTVLNRLCGHYKNWKDSWFAGTDLLERLKDKQ